MKRIIVLLAAALLLSACSIATLDSAGKELGDTLASAADAANQYVLMVKGGYRTDNPSITYDDAFSAFFGTPRWQHFESEDGQNVVEFTGDCTYQNVPVKARIQFVVDEENGTFEVTYLAFNEVPQNMLILSSLIEKAFEEAKSGGTGAADSGPADQLLYQGVPVDHLLGASYDSAVALLGEPDSSMFGGEELTYGANTVYFDLWNAAEPYLCGIESSSLEEFTYNGQIPFTSYFSETCTYKLGTTSFYDSDAGQMIDVDQLSIAGYQAEARLDALTGDGISGTWGWRNTNTVRTVLNADGTGYWLDHPIIWWENEGEITVEYQGVSTYDYYILGDTMEFFFSNGSKTFVKVGD